MVDSKNSLPRQFIIYLQGILSRLFQPHALTVQVFLFAGEQGRHSFREQVFCLCLNIYAFPQINGNILLPILFKFLKYILMCLRVPPLLSLSPTTNVSEFLSLMSINFSTHKHVSDSSTHDSKLPSRMSIVVPSTQVSDFPLLMFLSFFHSYLRVSALISLSFPPQSSEFPDSCL